MRQKRWNLLLLIAPVMVFITGAAIFLYPAISNIIAKNKQWDVIQSYNAKMNSKSEQELKKEREKAIVYNENLIGKPVHDPFVVDSGFVLPGNYQEVLNIGGDGVMCYLRIPKLDVHMPVYHGTEENVLQTGAGHLEMTSLPIGGIGNHAMLCAHRGLPSAELFSRLDEVKEGDRFYIHILNEIHAYEVDQIDIVKPEEMRYIPYDSQRDLITLMTCTPYGVNTHRLLVRGVRVSYKNKEKGERISNDWKQIYIVVLTLGTALIVVNKGFKKYEKKNR